MTPIVTIVVCGALMAALAVYRRRRLIRRLRETYARRFDVAAAGPTLDEYVTIVRRTLPSLQMLPATIPLDMRVDDRWLAATVALAAERFGVSLAELEYRFVSEPRMGTAGCAWRQNGSATMRQDGDHFVVTETTLPAPKWNIEIADRHRGDADVAFVIVAHEMAHVALFGHGVQLDPRRRNEELTDVAAFLAGFGDVMLRLSQRETWTEDGKMMTLRVGAVGYLHRDALEYLNTTYGATAS